MYICINPRKIRNNNSPVTDMLGKEIVGKDFATLFQTVS